METIRFRTYRFSDAVKLWGEELGDTAVYIADSGLCGGEATFAGKIAAISQKETKTGKPFFGVVFCYSCANFEIRLTFFILYYARACNRLTFSENYGTIGIR